MQGCVEVYGSLSELSAQGVDLKQLLGLMNSPDSECKEDEFSITSQAGGMCMSILKMMSLVPT